MHQTGQHARFESPHAIAIRPVRGPLDLAVVISEDGGGLNLQLWHGGSMELQSVAFDQVTHETSLTTDGRYVLAIDDRDGSEIGHLHAFPIGPGEPVDLTPGRAPYTIRGLDSGSDGRTVLLTGADDDGFFGLLTDVEDPDRCRTIFRSPNEAWSGSLSADLALAVFETTDHNPGVRRFAATVVDTRTGSIVATLSDGPEGPVRPVRFSQMAGDPRLLASTERTGFARPVVWDPTSGHRVDVELADLVGDVLPVDWHSPSGRLLLVHVEDGIHRVLEHDLRTGSTRPVAHPPGAYVEPDVAGVFTTVWHSYYTHEGVCRLVRGTWERPLEILEVRRDAAPAVVLPAADVPPGAPFMSHMVASRDGTRVQLWLGLPPEGTERRGTVLWVHGGPNLVTCDRYDPGAQAWIDDGWAYAALNYRGGVTAGREFREKYWGRVGEGELEDIEAALDWLEREGHATPGTTFITGESYGGFLTLLALGRLPGRFAGGFAHVAQADWIAAYPDMNPALQAAWRGFIGAALEDDPERWRRASPITYVSSVREPVWLNQGAFDTRTPPRQALRYAQALREAGGDVVIEMFDGGHMPSGLATRAHDHARMLELAERALRGERWSEAEPAL